MPLIGVHADLERADKRWILGALGAALALHLIGAWALGWYRIPGLEVPFNHSQPTGPFTVKRIEIDPAALKTPEANPLDRQPAVEPPQNPAEFNLDPNQVMKALQTPQPTLAVPNVPEPSKVIAATELNDGTPYTESQSAAITAQVAEVEPPPGSPIAASKVADDLISATAGPAQAGAPAGGLRTGDGSGALPGFAQIAPTLNPADTISKLPEPVLLRLPSDVLFDFDSAKLKPEAGALLQQAIGLITKYPQADVQIDGYTDSFGKTDYNSTLSQQRAEAVQAWLQDATQAKTGYKFRAQGHGSTDFIVSAQGTIEQQQPNRRVEILIQALQP